MNKDFGQYIKSKRELLLKTDVNYSQRQVAIRVGLEPTYLSQVERGLQNPPSEAKIIALAKDLDEDVNLLLALAGKVSDDLKKIIFSRPVIISELIHELKNMPNDSVSKLLRLIKNGWF